MTERENLEALVTAVDNLFWQSQGSPKDQLAAKVRLANAARRAKDDQNLRC